MIRNSLLSVVILLTITLFDYYPDIPIRSYRMIQNPVEEITCPCQLQSWKKYYLEMYVSRFGDIMVKCSECNRQHFRW